MLTPLKHSYSAFFWKRTLDKLFKTQRSELKGIIHSKIDISFIIYLFQTQMTFTKGDVKQIRHSQSTFFASFFI